MVLLDTVDLELHLKIDVSVGPSFRASTILSSHKVLAEKIFQIGRERASKQASLCSHQ